MGIGTKILNFFLDQKGWIPGHDKNLYSPSPWVLFFFLWNGKVHRCPTIQFCFSNSASGPLAVLKNSEVPHHPSRCTSSTWSISGSWHSLLFGGSNGTSLPVCNGPKTPHIVRDPADFITQLHCISWGLLNWDRGIIAKGIHLVTSTALQTRGQGDLIRI